MNEREGKILGTGDQGVSRGAALGTPGCPKRSGFYFEFDSKPVEGLPQVVVE